jgi:V8-like Glu-specific endopeptidase
MIGRGREIVLGALLILLASWCRADVPLEMILRAKQATALVEVQNASGGSEGSAFCIDGTGLFVTNAHVVDPLPVGGKLILILRSGEKDQKTAPAHVVVLDKESDLAVLQSDATLKLTPLTLGSTDNLIETMSVVICGYPFGSGLSLKEGDYPSITVSTGHITALRKSKGELQAIQVDASLAPGNSGGPVLDARGDVVGIVQKGIRGSGINSAIPVASLQTLLARSRVLFTPPKIARSQLRAIQEFRIQLLIPPPVTAGVTIDLTLSANPDDRRSFRAVSTDRRLFLVQTPLLPAVKESDGLLRTAVPTSVAYRITAKQDGKIIGDVQGKISLSDRNLVRTEKPGSESAGGGRRQGADESRYLRDPASGHWYGAVHMNHSVTWEEAKAAAQALQHEGRSGHLVTITSAAESDFVVRLFPQAVADKCWLGAYKDAQAPDYKDPTAGWHWVTGEPWKYTHWNGTEPNGDVGGPHSDYIQFSQDGHWNDERNAPPDTIDAARWFIVEFEP